jgi:muconolactone delta-isomerase
VLFLVIATSSERLDPAEIGDAPLRSNAYRQQLVADGTIVQHAHIAGHRGHMYVYDVDSVDELDAVIGNDPMSRFLDASPQIYPLVSEERLQERFRSLAARLPGSE